MSLEQIAKVLTEHHVAVVSSNGTGTALVMCSCSHESEVAGSADLDYGDYAVVNAAHQAAVLAPLFAAAKAEAWDECENAKYEIRLNAGDNSWGAVKNNPYRTT